MTAHVSAKRSKKTPLPDALLDAACRIVSTDGLAGLTLRPLAQLLDVSVTVLTKHYGARADIIGAVCQAACARDARLCSGWRQTLATLPPLQPAMAALLADTILEEMATVHRPIALLYLELLHACTWDPSLRPVFAAWSEQRQTFWDELAGKAGLDARLRACGWWHGYVIAELAYSMVLNGVAPYRMLRRVCLHRMFGGAVATAPDAADGALFSLLLDQLRLPPDTDACTGSASPWSALAARACGIRLAAEGVHGLTHRTIAADIGVPHTTLSYRYPTQHDLVIAGLEHIAAHILAAVDAGSMVELERLRLAGDGRKLDLARANFAVALAAARMPGLTAYTADMRSRRGNNLVKVFRQYLPDATGIDGLCAQVISMGLTGLTNTEPAGESSERTVAAAFAAAAAWLGRGS